MSKKYPVNKLETIQNEIKKNHLLRATLQRRVPALITNNDEVELEIVYNQIAKLSNVIYGLEQQRFYLKKNES